MIQLRSILKPADNCGAKKFRVIQVYGGSKRNFGSIGDVALVAVDQADQEGVVKDSQLVKVVIVRTKKEIMRKDGSRIRFDDNAAVAIDGIKTKNPLGTRTFGPVAREIKEKGFTKIASLAKEVL